MSTAPKRLARLKERVQGQFIDWPAGMTVLARCHASNIYSIERPRWDGPLTIRNVCDGIPSYVLDFLPGDPIEPPQRVQRKRTAGFRLPEHTICVDRTSYLWGNHFVVGQDCETQAEAAGKHAEWLRQTKDGRRTHALAQLLLHGWNLACFCAEGTPCHGDNLLKAAAGPLTRDFEKEVKAEIKRLMREGDAAERGAYHRDAAVLRRRAFNYKTALKAALGPGPT